MRVAYFVNAAGIVALCAATIIAQGISDSEFSWRARPYTPQPENAIRVQTNMVEVGVVVRDTHGKVIGGLEQSDFEVLDNNKPQKISFFSVEKADRPLAVVPASPSPNKPASAPTPAPALQPRYIAFFLDDTSMPEGDLAFARRAAEQFVNESLEPEDRVGIFTSSNAVLLEFTADKDKLLETLENVRTHQKKAQGGALACPYLAEYQAYLITQTNGINSDDFNLAVAQAIACHACTDASRCRPFILANARETLAVSEHIAQDTLEIIRDVILHLSSMPGRRMLVLTCSGFMAQTEEPRRYQGKLIDAALHAGIVINSLDAKGLWAAPPGGDPGEGIQRVVGPLGAYQDRLDVIQMEINDDPLAALAESTGGRFFHNSNDLGGGLREMAALPEVSYVLGFSPPEIRTNGAFHTLKVKIANKHGFTVEARRGYYAPSPANSSAAVSDPTARSEKLDRAVRSPDLSSDVSMKVNAESSKLDSGDLVLSVAVHVDIRNLPFQHLADRNVERLIFVTALFDQQNHFQTGVQGVMDLNLKNSTFTRISSQGFDVKILVPASPGNYRLRQVVQEEVSGRLAALSTPVEIQ
ncbi:MAG TPA: VWA domain-containing protein [Candidatus Limnocylindrales bacterium]|nr:VWA domain-containing protein [Candidatus Limnocylindrales bacterium]